MNPVQRSHLVNERSCFQNDTLNMYGILAEQCKNTVNRFCCSTIINYVWVLARVSGLHSFFTKINYLNQEREFFLITSNPWSENILTKSTAPNFSSKCIHQSIEFFPTQSSAHHTIYTIYIYIYIYIYNIHTCSLPIRANNPRVAGGLRRVKRV